MAAKRKRTKDKTKPKRLINHSAVKDYCNARGVHVTEEALIRLENWVHAALILACDRAVGNNRTRLMDRDV